MSEKDDKARPELTQNTRKKSEMLFEVMGWTVMYNRPVFDGDGNKISITEFTWTHYEDERWVDLYHHKNFGLAWRVLNWFESKIDNDDTGADHFDHQARIILSEKLRFYARQTVEVAQQLILDRILSQCISTGLIEAEKKDESIKDDG